ncbi:hypothetical protein [Microbacterium sp. CFBP 8794]|uniref:hypothetical protein n=1 Tax=Microbacterium sp. CFBP 8794 TaxID=2775269 RepID=UPI0017876CA5|nr:hypothetical protein [Microbacterium sp. CFBP 8794]MBD8477595.1 hypothetical protein [Microbacterium sp. CFBP 8794]
MTERIDHARLARENLNVVGSRPMLPEVASVTATAALVHATLALVEQQRIANLISLMQMQTECDETTEYLAGEAMHALIDFERTPATPFGGPDEHPVIRSDIREGLGL